MTRLIGYPLIAFLLIGLTTHSNITPSSQTYSEMGLNPSQLFAELNRYTTAKISQATKEIDEKTALNLVWKLPQVQRKAKEIARLSKGTIKVAAIVDGSPTPNEPYYIVRVFEDEPADHNTTIYWFRVSSTTGVIEVLDVIDNKYITLEAWREQLKR